MTTLEVFPLTPQSWPPGEGWEYAYSEPSSYLNSAANNWGQKAWHVQEVDLPELTVPQLAPGEVAVKMIAGHNIQHLPECAAKTLGPWLEQLLHQH